MLSLIAALSCTDSVPEPQDTQLLEADTATLDTGTENQAPSVAIAEPTEGAVFGRGEPLRLSALVLDDKDGPEVLAVVWCSDLDGELPLTPIEGQDYSYLSALSPGEHLLTVEVTDKGGLSASETRPVLVDLPPTAPELLMEPAQPTTEDDLVVTITAPSEDPEGETPVLRIQWFVDGLLLPELTELSVPASQTFKGETWRAEVSASDSYGPGAAGTAELTIENSPPSAPVLRMDASQGDTPMVCSESVPAVDLDADELSRTITWEADGALYPDDFPDAEGPSTTTLPGDTVPLFDLALAESFTCTLSVSDGETSVSASISAGLASSFDVGYTSEFSGSSVHGKNYLLGHPVTVSTAMTVSHLNIIAKGSAANGQIALYTESGGQPSALVTESSAQAITTGTNTFDVPDTAIPAGTYWLMAVYDASAYIGESSTPQTVYYTGMSAGSAMPDPIGSLNSYSGGPHNYYLSGF